MKLFKQSVQNSGRSGVETAAQGNTEFAFALYQKLRTAEGSLFFSPYSISTALAMTYAGAHGDTESQMAQALHFLLGQKQLHPAFALLQAQLGEAGKKGNIHLRIANSLWLQKEYACLEEFVGLMKQYYGVLISAVDYGNAEAARQTINAWVEARTESKIKDLIPPGTLDALTCLILVNAIYFKGDWASPFDHRLTHKSPFRVTAGEQVQVMMMTQKHAFRYGKDNGLQILELPYAGDSLSMFVLLPREFDELAKLESALTVENLERWRRNLDETKVEVFLPRFEITFPFRLDDTLRSLGMVDAFSSKADFTGMYGGSKELHIGAVLHKAFAVVSEEGTEAAAATAVMAERSLPAPAPIFRADHPFVFMICENVTGSILFLGRMVNPASGST